MYALYKSRHLAFRFVVFLFWIRRFLFRLTVWLLESSFERVGEGGENREGVRERVRQGGRGRERERERERERGGGEVEVGRGLFDRVI